MTDMTQVKDEQKSILELKAKPKNNLSVKNRRLDEYLLNFENVHRKYDMHSFSE